MKVLILGSKEYPASFKLEGCGGIEVHVEAITENLKKKGVELFLITRKAPQQKSSEHQERLHIYRVPYMSGKFFRTFTFNLASFFLSLYLIPKHNIHLIHANDFTSGFFSAMTKAIVNRPLLLSAPTFGSRQPEWPSVVRSILRSFEKSSLRNANRIFLFSTNDVEYASEVCQVIDKKIDFLVNGVDFGRFENARPIKDSEVGLRIRPDSRIVVFVGRLTKSKGLSFLLQAFNGLTGSVDATLILVGDGPEASSLKELVKQMRLEDSVIFLGSRRDVERWLKITDVFVLPSVYEGFPVALVEAMAARKPIVATRVGAIPSIIENGVSGVLVDPSNPEDLSDKLLTLLRNKDFRTAISEKAHLIAKQRYSWTAVADRVYEAYLCLTEETQLSN